MIRALTNVVLAAICLLLPVHAVHAHAVIAAAYVDGSTIEGEVAFSNGDVAANAKIDVFSSDGTLILETTTDADGVFVFEAERRMDHAIKIDLGAGHVAEITVTAEELPESLAAGPSTGSRPAASDLPVTQTVGMDKAELEAAIRSAVNREIRPLRQQLTQYENKVRWHDILGGLGFIAGITGVAFWCAAKRRTVSREP